MEIQLQELIDQIKKDGVDAAETEAQSILDSAKAEAEKIKLQVQQWMNTLTRRMQRIIRLRYFEEMSWEDVAKTMGRKATTDSIRMEFERTMKENIEKK